MAILPKKNPDFKWEVPKGRDISNLALQKGGVDSKTTLRLVPAHLASIANKIQHLTKLLEAEIRVYDTELAKCEVSEIRRIQSAEREAIENHKKEVMGKERKKIVKGLRGFDRILAKQDGLTPKERQAKTFHLFLQTGGDSIPKNLRDSAQEFIDKVREAYGDGFLNSDE